MTNIIKSLRRHYFLRTAILVVLLIAIPQTLTARGAQEMDAVDAEAFFTEIEEILVAVESGDLTVEEAQTQFEELHAADLEDHPEFAEGEGNGEILNRVTELLEAIASGEMTADEVDFQFAQIREREVVRRQEAVEEQERIQDGENKGKGPAEGDSFGEGEGSSSEGRPAPADAETPDDMASPSGDQPASTDGQPGPSQGGNE